MSSGLWKSPDALIFLSAALNSSFVHGESVVGTRMPYLSRIVLRVTMTSATS